jgi:hypothetical protein
MSTSGASGSIRLRLSRPNVEYDIVSETNRNFSLEQADRANFKRFEDIDLANNERLILVSPNGTRYSVTVDNSGNLGTTAI